MRKEYDFSESRKNPYASRPVRNFHLPLPEQIYIRLRAEAERTQVPATTLAREAVDEWLRQQSRKARHDAIAEFASDMAGTPLDLDADLESAGIEHLVKTGKRQKRRSAPTRSAAPDKAQRPDRT